MKTFRTVPIIIALGLSSILAGCEKTQKNITSEYVLPSFMAECKVVELKSDNMNIDKIRAIYCPHADVSTQTKNGKTNQYTSVVIEKDNTRVMTPEEYAEHYNRTNK